MGAISWVNRVDFKKVENKYITVLVPVDADVVDHEGNVVDALGGDWDKEEVITGETLLEIDEVF